MTKKRSAPTSLEATHAPPPAATFADDADADALSLRAATTRVARYRPRSSKDSADDLPIVVAAVAGADEADTMLTPRAHWSDGVRLALEHLRSARTELEHVNLPRARLASADLKLAASTLEDLLRNL